MISSNRFESGDRADVPAYISFSDNLRKYSGNHNVNCRTMIKIIGYEESSGPWTYYGLGETL